MFITGVCVCVYYRIIEILQCIAVLYDGVIYYSLQYVLPVLYLNIGFLLMKSF